MTESERILGPITRAVAHPNVVDSLDEELALVAAELVDLGLEQRDSAAQVIALPARGARHERNVRLEDPVSGCWFEVKSLLGVYCEGLEHVTLAGNQTLVAWWVSRSLYIQCRAHQAAANVFRGSTADYKTWQSEAPAPWSELHTQVLAAVHEQALQAWNAGWMERLRVSCRGLIARMEP